MEEGENTLYVKHIPSVLTENEQGDLLKHFGATHVRCMGGKGPLKHCAFAAFESHHEAKCALKRLHQLKVLDSVLCAEFSKKSFHKFHPKLLENPKVKNTQDDVNKKLFEEKAAEKFKEKQVSFLEQLNNTGSKWGIQHPYNPKLEYMYAPPSVSILTNIANALASHPQFYVQVLHLMNKLNLPPPFGATTPTPPLPEELPNPPPVPPEPETLSVTEMEMSSSEESELESDTDVPKISTDSVKRTTEQSKPRKKKHKVQHIVSAAKGPVPGTTQDVSSVFEKPQIQQQKKIELKLGPSLGSVHEALQGFLIKESSLQETVLSPPKDLLEVVNKNTNLEVGGFGKLEPQQKDEDTEADASESEDIVTEFITFNELKKGRLSETQMKEFNVFKNYSSGEPTTRLYIKNLAKQTDEKDLRRIYGRYIDWGSEQEQIMFDIRLMKEGRMKGQAFITLANEEASQIALKETNTFVLNGKPMVVQFARSAKPKEKS